jgi:hypothetical protein
MLATGLRTSPPAKDAHRFGSLSEMQARHAALAKETSGDLLADGNPQRIAEFVRRGVATGAILDAKEERVAAQALINFWSSRLNSARRDAQRSQAANEACAVPRTADCDLEETLLEEFDPATIRAATEEAEKWIGTLADEDRAIVRRILLRLVRLVGEGQSFELVPATRAALYELDPSPEKVEAMIRRLVGFGIVRVTPGSSSETDLVSLRNETPLEVWGSFKTWLNERLGFRRQVIAWDKAGRPTAQLQSGDALEEARSYNDRNPSERLFVELSRREEILQNKRGQERRRLYFLAAVVLGVGTLVFGIMAYKWYHNAQLATLNEQMAGAEMVRAQDQETLARRQGELAEKRRDVLEYRQQLSEVLALVRTLAVIGGGSVAEREIAFQRLDAFRKQSADSPKVKWFFENEAGRLDTIRAHPDREKEFREIQNLALNLARSLRYDLFKASTIGGQSPDESKIVPEDVGKILDDERAVIFQTVEFCASRIVDIARNPELPFHRADPYLREFWVLYWGEMGVVEGRKVERDMVEIGKSFKQIDQRILERINAGKGSMEYLKGTITLKGLTNRQAIQSIYDAAKSVAKSGLKLEEITGVRLDPKDDAPLLTVLAAKLDTLKQSLAQEAALPFQAGTKAEPITY